MLQILLIAAATVSLAACEEKLRTPPNTVEAVPEPKPAPPAFKAGMTVIDRTGAQAGVIQAVTETPGGLNVVIEIDGKLVGVRPATLRLREASAVSTQTKAEMLASAGAPR